MSGVGSTNAMKKGSANNPFLAYSEADMQGFLNSAYTGCIVKYTGPAINRALSEQNKTVPEYAQNLVFNRVNYGWPYFYDGNVKFIITEKTNEGTNTWYLAAGKYINGAWDFSRNGAFNGDVVLTNSLGANPTSIRKLWTPKDKWNNNYINDQGNLTFWTYDEDVVFTIAPIDNNDIDYTDLTGITIVPYKVNELYKVVYGDGEYYYEEFYHISDTPTTANSDYIAPGKTAFDFTGNLQTGNGSKINPYIASTTDEMAAYLTSSYKGAFVKYIGETVAVGGTPVPVNPIAIDDTISKLYFDTTKDVDFSKFVYDQPFGDDIPTGVAILLSSQQNVNILTANDLSVAGMSGYVLMLMEKTSQTSADVRQTILYASEALPDLGVSQEGWQSGTSLDLLQGNTISIVNAQDIWGAYISKDGQWTSSGGESYVKNAIYQVAEDGDATRYAILPTLSNPGTASDLAQGKQLIDGEGKVVEGEAVNPEGKLAMDLFAKTITDINDTQGSITSWPAMYYPDSGIRAAFCTNCKQLSRVILSNMSSSSGAIIPSMAFYGCNNLKYINVGYFSQIRDSAFYGCNNLREIKGLDNVDYITNNAFRFAKFIQDDEFVLPKFSKLTQLKNDNTFTQAELFDITDETFPALTFISGFSMFYNTKNITKLSLTNLETISGYYTFQYCEDLKEINCPKLSLINCQDCFRGCYKLSSINMPAVSYIGSGVFSNCTAITYISLPAVRTLSAGTFGYCSFSKIVLPSLSKMYNDPFYNCKALVSVYLPNSIVCSATSNIFYGTPMRSLYSEAGYNYGSIYVPMSLLSQYQSAPYWSNLSSRIVGLTDEEFASVLT